MSQGVIVQVSVSAGGVPKRAVLQAHVGTLGLEGDQQAKKEIHGGPERAVCLYAMERLEALAAEGHPIGPGSAGENVTTRGIDWDAVGPGARLRLGERLVLEISAYTPPCKTNARWFKDGDFNRISQKRFPGWSRTYARVITPGPIRPGDPVELINPATG